ncbi:MULTISPECIES: universal stress protein [Synechocystis]|uniref:Universal stress protein n=1 Tax=Synechocystis salina LEGE 00031 TaxID=1828736 RepID=A0ABR9VRW3_9SYNC|nr:MULTISPECIES: universal stress protein [Synechocystis]MBD2652830.1 universal stress protein [Synechocystis sp. FACHB-383]MBE9240995.1 universal stress protein [Synechocystis salina LEGE 00041]MBE9254099.1 universal stress protein [Synechocystis salina LEGE 00031]
MFKHCLICTDFSDGLQRLAGFVEELSLCGISKLIFLHTVSVWEDEHLANVDESKLKEAKIYLESLVGQVPAGVEVKVEVSSVRYLDLVNQLVEREAIDVIINGMPVRSNLESKLFGSHTLSLAKSTKVPVMILRPQLITTYTVEEMALRCQHLWRNLLVPYDASSAGNYLVERLKTSLEKAPPGKVQSCYFLSILEDGIRRPELMENRRQEAEEKLAMLKQEFSSLVPDIVTEVRHGNPVQEILDTAFVNDITAIAVASHRTTLLDWTVPSLTDNILNRSWFPLLFFSPKG